MNKNTLITTLLAAMVVSLTSCQAIGDIFKAGMWVGIIVVVVIIAVVLWLIGKVRK
jgi:FtsH-binding integral membrane protein